MHIKNNKMCNTREYKIWIGIKTRCYNPNHNTYKNYGAKGIEMDDNWANSFEIFLKDVGYAPTSKHSLDRYPNKTGNYEPGNVRWATHKEQMNNRVDSLTFIFKGEEKTLGQWADKLGVARTTLWARIYISKMPLEKAFLSTIDARGGGIAKKK